MKALFSFLFLCSFALGTAELENSQTVTVFCECEKIRKNDDNEWYLWRSVVRISDEKVILRTRVSSDLDWETSCYAKLRSKDYRHICWPDAPALDSKNSDS